ncbi:MAG: ATP-binding protein [Anaerolineae bacterium]
MILISPTAMGYVPIFLLHAVSLGYLLHKRHKSRQTWLFCGWLGGMTLMTATQCAAATLYVPWLSAYLGWWGGVSGVTLAMIALLQFAYHSPRLRYDREARTVLVISGLLTGGLFAWMLWETLTALPHHLYARAPADPLAALASPTGWLSYDFERFTYGLVSSRDAGALVSFKAFDLWQLVGNVWVLGIWLRKTIQFSTDAAEAPFWQRAWGALWRPQGREAQRARAWVLLMLLAPLPVIASSLDGTDMAPPGTFAIVHLLVLFAMMLTYVNYAPEPTSFMVKLVGISLVTLLVILGMVANYGMTAYQEAYRQMRRAELRHIQTLLQTGRFDALPADARYVASRPVEGLFAAEYRLLVAQPGAPTAAALVAHDALYRAGLLQGHFPTRYAVLHEHPWLGREGVLALEQNAAALAAARIPEAAFAYRGASAPPAAHLLRYTFGQQETLYEVGYDYGAYRAYLHQKALPLLALFVGTTLGILLIFPRFFRVGLVAPLTRLLAGVERVNQGALDGAVPVFVEDELGQLTYAFNRMVGSLRRSETQLRTLNLTLEQRVADRTRDLATLYEIAALVNQTQPLETLLAVGLAQIVPAVGGEAGVIGLRSEDNGDFSLAAQQGLAPALETEIMRLSVWETVYTRGELLLVHDLARDTDAGTLFPTEFPYATFVGAPLRGQKAALGVLVIFGARPLLFNVENLEVLEAVAEQLGIAVENARLREQAAAALVLEERQRLARDLHDSVTQLLYSQTLFATAATQSLQGGQSEKTTYYLGRLSETVRRALREMRLLIYGLRPAELAQVGLVGALRRRLEMVEQRAGIRVHLSAEPAAALPAALEAALYHIAEESLNNALKHANASEIWVMLHEEEDNVRLCITDNGCGFDVGQISPGLGLQSLHERAAELGGSVSLDSAPGAGTRICVAVPVKK